MAFLLEEGAGRPLSGTEGCEWWTIPRMDLAKRTSRVGRIDGEFAQDPYGELDDAQSLKDDHSESDGKGYGDML